MKDNEERTTIEDLAPQDVFSWPLVMGMLERIGDWAPHALRLGTLALVQECVRSMAQRDATGDHIVTMRELVDALAHMPWKEHGS